MSVKRPAVSIAALGRAGAAVLTAAALSLAAPAAGAYAANTAPPAAAPIAVLDSTVEVSGQATVKADPTVVTLNLGIVSSRDTPREAYEVAAAATQRVVDALRGAGVAEKDVTAAQITVTTRYIPGHYPDILDYLAEGSIRATVRDMPSAPHVLDAAVTAGTFNIKVGSITFDLDDNRPAVAQARELAYRDAQSKAEQYASLSGRILGKPVAITEVSAPAPGPITGQPAPTPPPGAPPFPVSPGPFEVAVTVRVVYALF
ncbi:SIMPL domain-containing protein [Yinghuangia seranimata]|uniref:SIMPL domain-containing protein n=1 Tax=Yinghuangia seranimata TaxID=408067 RepID=UPI00248C0AE3|nr:SIMPL domain-containing protein [Yinghuangia seranimata]MDI2132162.1 SIMPL domain-containing protein [Yinghuangia seranimata]